jgi:hypothetical protein
MYYKFRVFPIRVNRVPYERNEGRERGAARMTEEYLDSKVFLGLNITTNFITRRFFLKFKKQKKINESQQH